MNIKFIKLTKHYSDSFSIEVLLVERGVLDDPLQAMENVKFALVWLDPAQRQAITELGDPTAMTEELERIRSMADDDFAEEYTTSESRLAWCEKRAERIVFIKKKRAQYKRNFIVAHNILKNPTDWLEPSADEVGDGTDIVVRKRNHKTRF